MDRAAYAAMAWTPAEPAALEDAGYVRDLRVARLTVYPLQYRAATGELRHVQRMRLHVRFVGGRTSAPSAERADPGEFGRLLRQMVVNPQWVDAWRGGGRLRRRPRGVTGRALSRASRATASPCAKPASTGSTYADLVAAGLPVATLDPRRLSMYQGDQELAIEVTGEADGRFDPGDEIRFYAEQVQSFYTDVNTLWLVIGTSGPAGGGALGGASGRHPGATSFPATQHFEQNRIYRSNMPMASDVDHWYWGQMFVLNQTKVPTLTVPFTITHPLPTGTARLAWSCGAGPRIDA